MLSSPPKTKRLWIGLKMTKQTRERWLLSAATMLDSSLFAPNGAIMPNYRVSVGWPRRGKKGTIGQCWSDKASEDKHHEIFISPTLDDGAKVLSTLAHEMVHACVGLEAKHGKAFRKVAIAIGLEGKMTSTVASEAFKHATAQGLTELGPYPHARLNVNDSTRQKAGTRLLKVQCPACGYTVRTTRKWLDLGAPICPTDMESMLEPI